jgi:A/G-specific adenine glycosylase
MLQQTRVETVIPYYERWMARIPTVEALALADLDHVLALWEGLGYYRRAIHMHETAAIIQAEGGEFPDMVEELRRLPGIGEYTAAALASIAFNEDVLAMDGNLRRVFSRIFAFGEDLRQSGARRRLKRMANELLPAGKAGDFNQAVMDLGSLICLPKGPKCMECPVSSFCRAKETGSQNQLPVQRPRGRVPQVHAVAAVLEQGEQVLLGRRSQESMLAGLWEYPGGRLEPGESEPEALQREIQEELGIEIQVGERIGTYQHSYTHFKVFLSAYRCLLVRGRPRTIVHSKLAWAPIEQLGEFPMGKIDRLISNDLARTQGIG